MSQDPEARARATLEVILAEFLELDPRKRGSVCIHFTEDRKIRKVEWNTHVDADRWPLEEAS